MSGPATFGSRAPEYRRGPKQGLQGKRFAAEEKYASLCNSSARSAIRLTTAPTISWLMSTLTSVFVVFPTELLKTIHFYSAPQLSYRVLAEVVVELASTPALQERGWQESCPALATLLPERTWMNAMIALRYPPMKDEDSEPLSLPQPAPTTTRAS